MKLKSHSGLKKRVKKSKGKLMMQKSSKKHLLSNKSKRQKGLFRGGMPVNKTNRNKIRKLLPYGTSK